MRRQIYCEAIPEDLRKRLSRDKELEPWMKILVWSPDVRLRIRQAIVLGLLENTDTLKASSAFGIDEGGCIDLQNVKEVVDYFVPDPTVYYFGIGNARYDLDIITPLVATGFKVLIGADIMPATFPEFKEAVKRNLSLTMEIDPAKTVFRKLFGGEFSASFIYRGRKRRVIGIFNYDATTGYPPRLSRGCHVIFTRRTGVVFSRILPPLRRQLFGKLFAMGLVVVDEQVFDHIAKSDAFPSEEFLEIDLRDYFSADTRWLNDMDMFRFRRVFVKKS